MTKWIGAAILALTLMLGGSTAINPAAAAPLPAAAQKPQPLQPTDLSTRRRYRHDRYGHRPYSRPYYYARPDYYRPYPYDAPAPFPCGFGFGPWW
jgi:hypothetical protein